MRNHKKGNFFLETAFQFPFAIKFHVSTNIFALKRLLPLILLHTYDLQNNFHPWQKWTKVAVKTQVMSFLGKTEQIIFQQRSKNVYTYSAIFCFYYQADWSHKHYYTFMWSVWFRSICIITLNHDSRNNNKIQINKTGTSLNPLKYLCPTDLILNAKPLNNSLSGHF